MSITRYGRVVLPVLAILVLSACVPLSTPAPGSAGIPVPVGAQGEFPVTLVDDMGRQVVVGAVPQRVVSLAPSLTEVLFAVGAGDQVVGVTEWCDYPEEAKSREKVGGFSANTISVEKIVALRPDLVFSAGHIHEPIMGAMEGVGLRVVAVDPASVVDVYGVIERLGLLTGHAEQAKSVAAAMKARIDAVVAKTSTVPEAERPRVYWQIWDEPLMTAGPSTFAGQMIELVGAINIFGELTEAYPQISAEEVVKRDPDVIVGPDTHGDKLTLEVFRQRPGWADIKAVRTGRIYLIDGNIVSREGPRLADALEDVAKALYPDLFL